MRLWRARCWSDTLRAELENELNPDQYQAAWEKGSGEEAEDIVVRILRKLESPPEVALEG